MLGETLLENVGECRCSERLFLITWGTAGAQRDFTWKCRCSERLLLDDVENCRCSERLYLRMPMLRETYLTTWENAGAQRDFTRIREWWTRVNQISQ